MTIKDDVKNYLDTIAPKSVGPTAIGRALGFDYGCASGSVTQPLKDLVAEGWAVRHEKPVRYGKRQD